MREIFAKHPHWQQVLSIVQALNKKGFIAYLAGGAVRDALLDHELHDFDIATSARPEDIEKLIKNDIGKAPLDIGKQFGIIMVPIAASGPIESGRIEIATFRSDSEYEDGRHPKSVSFSDAKEDAKRRDFTVNALFYDIKDDRVIDFVGGLDDLKNGVIRAVGDPAKRFDEDKLRILRAIRFSAQLDFQIEAGTYRAVQQLASQIRIVSNERITAELERLSQTRALISGFAALIDSGLFQILFEPFHFVHDERLRRNFLRALARFTGIGSLELILSLMIVIENVQHRRFDPLSLSRAAYHRIEFLVNGVKALENELEDALIDLNSDDGPLLSELGFALESIELLPQNRMSSILEKFLSIAGESGRLPLPFLNGNDLIGLGISPGPKFKEILDRLYKMQLRGEILNRDDALAAAKATRT